MNIFEGQGLGFRVWNLYFRVWGFEGQASGDVYILRAGCEIQDSWFGVSDPGFRAPGFGFQISGFGFRVSGFWFRVSVFGFWVSGFVFVGAPRFPVERKERNPIMSPALSISISVPSIS